MGQQLFNRRVFASAVGLSLACVFTPRLLAQARPEKTKLFLGVGGKAAFYALPLTIAEQLGYFRDEGLELTIMDFANDQLATQAALDGAVDAVSGYFDETIALQSHGHAFQAFVLQGRAPQIVVGVCTKTLPSYKSLVDLRGKKIGVAAAGSVSHMVARMVFSRAGIKPDEATFVPVGTGSNALAAVRSGQVEAISSIDPLITQLEQKGEIRVISDTRTLKGTHELFGGAAPGGCLFAAASFLEKNPETAQALSNAIVRALKWLQTAGPGDIIKTVPESYLLGDRALYLASFEKMRDAIALDGVIPEEGTKVALKALAGFDPAVKSGQIDLAKTFTNVFARNAKLKFKV